jgi:hypothetical protein
MYKLGRGAIRGSFDFRLFSRHSSAEPQRLPITVARYLFLHHTKMVKNKPKNSKYTKMYLKYTKGLKHLPKFSTPRPSKKIKAYIFGLKIYHLATLLPIL